MRMDGITWQLSPGASLGGCGGRPGQAAGVWLRSGSVAGRRGEVTPSGVPNVPVWTLPLLPGHPHPLLSPSVPSGAPRCPLTSATDPATPAGEPEACEHCHRLVTSLDRARDGGALSVHSLHHSQRSGSKTSVLYCHGYRCGYLPSYLPLPRTQEYQDRRRKEEFLPEHGGVLEISYRNPSDDRHVW